MASLTGQVSQKCQNSVNSDYQSNQILSEGANFLPYNIAKLVLKNCNIPKQVVEEKFSELWYETLNGSGTATINNVKYTGNIINGILDSRIPKGSSNPRDSELSLINIQKATSQFIQENYLDRDEEDDDLYEKRELLSEIIFPDGTTYKGTVHHNKIDGKGTFTFPSGAVYSGEVKNGLRDGYGTYISDCNEIAYEGQWKNGLKHGLGKMTKPNMIYDGNWCNGVIHGYGELHWIQTGNVYRGEFNKTNLEGNGCLYWCTNLNPSNNYLPKNFKPSKNKVANANNDNNNFNSEPVNNNLNNLNSQNTNSNKNDLLTAGNNNNINQKGNANMQNTNSNNLKDKEKSVLSSIDQETLWSTNEKYLGEWKNNLQDGRGMHIWYEPKGEQKALRNRYIGFWKEGKKNGYGVFFYSNGSKYEGYWLNDRKEGFGITTNLDRSQNAGIYHEDIITTNIKVGDVESAIFARMKEKSLWNIMLGKNIMGVFNSNKDRDASKDNMREIGKDLRDTKENITKNTNVSRLDRKSPPRRQKSNVLPSTKKDILPKKGINKIQINSGIPITTGTTDKDKDKDTINKMNDLTVRKVSDGKTNADRILDLDKLKNDMSNKNALISIDLSDLVIYDPSIKDRVTEIDNICLRNISDITKWYNMISGKDNAYGDYSVNITTENTVKPVIMNSKEKQTFNNVNANNGNTAAASGGENTNTNNANANTNAFNAIEKNRQVVNHNLFIEESYRKVLLNTICNNDYYFCLELKDIWKFFRDYCNIINLDFTCADMDRIFFSGIKNYFEMFYVPEDILHLDLIKNKVNIDVFYNYFYMMIDRSKYDFDCKYNVFSKGTINFPGNVTNKNNYNTDTFQNFINLHNKKQVILPKQFYELVVRISHMCPLKYQLRQKVASVNPKLLISNFSQKNDDDNKENKYKNYTIEDNLKFFINYIKNTIKERTLQSKKREKGNTSHSNISFIFDKKGDHCFELFLNEYELLLENIYKGIYNLYKENPDDSDMTVTYEMVYNTLSKIKYKKFNEVINPKSTFCEIALGLSAYNNIYNKNESNKVTSRETKRKPSIVLTQKIDTSRKNNVIDTVMINPFKEEPKWIKQCKILANEMVCYEFCELFFNIQKRYISQFGKKIKFGEILEYISMHLCNIKEKNEIKRQNSMGRYSIIYPMTDKHRIIIENNEKKRLILEMLKKKELENKRVQNERKNLGLEDINKYVEEEVKNSEEEYEEDE